MCCPGGIELVIKQLQHQKKEPLLQWSDHYKSALKYLVIKTTQDYSELFSYLSSLTAM